jgi:hypothetical protein
MDSGQPPRDFRNDGVIPETAGIVMGIQNSRISLRGNHFDPKMSSRNAVVATTMGIRMMATSTSP